MYSYENWTMAIFYFFTIMLFFNSSSILMIWMMMEVNLIVFIIIMKLMENSNKKEKDNQKLLYYFMIQTIGSILFLLGSTMQNTMILESKMIVMLSILLKMGLFPLEKWVYKITKNLENTTFLILITLQKIPMMIIFMQLESTMQIIMLTVSMIMGSILLMKSKEIKELLISSSIYATLWFIIGMSKGLPLFILTYAKYSFANMILLSGKLLGENKSKMNMIMMLMASMFVLGLPPFEMFFLKVFVIKIMESNTQMILFMILWSTSFLSTFSYFKFLYSSFMKSEKMKKTLMNSHSMSKILISLSAVSVMLFI